MPKGRWGTVVKPTQRNQSLLDKVFKKFPRDFSQLGGVGIDEKINVELIMVLIVFCDKEEVNLQKSLSGSEYAVGILPRRLST